MSFARNQPGPDRSFIKDQLASSTWIILKVFANLSSIVNKGTEALSGRMLQCCDDNVGNAVVTTTPDTQLVSRRTYQILSLSFDVSREQVPFALLGSSGSNCAAQSNPGNIQQVSYLLRISNGLFSSIHLAKMSVKTTLLLLCVQVDYRLTFWKQS